MAKRYKSRIRSTHMVLDALDILYPDRKPASTSLRFVFRFDDHVFITFENAPKSSIEAFLFGDKKSADKRVQSVDAKGWSKTFTSFN